MRKFMDFIKKTLPKIFDFNHKKVLKNYIIDEATPLGIISLLKILFPGLKIFFNTASKKNNYLNTFFVSIMQGKIPESLEFKTSAKVFNKKLNDKKEN